MAYNRRYNQAFTLIMTDLIMLISLLFWSIPSVSHGEVTLDGTLGPKGAVGSGTLPDCTFTDYLISHDLGKQVGSNLFHSFGKFNVGTNESATFTGPNSIDNIIGRVTGGTESWIDGLLRSTIDGANLFLLNPNGVLFGPNATLDVKGSFHVSTADYLRFEGGERFYINPAENSVLSVASPAAFGFLTDNPASITVQESMLEVPEGETLSLMGGDIDIVGGLTGWNYYNLNAPSGRINIASVASPGEVTPNTLSELPDLHVDSEQMGEITFSQWAFATVAGNPGGTILIRGGRFVMDDSWITAATRGDVDHPGIGIDVNLTDELILTNGAEIASSSFAEGDGGNMRIEAGSLQVIGDPFSDRYSMGLFSNIGSRAFGTVPDAGDAGDVEIITGSLLVKDNAFISAPALGPGAGGTIKVVTDKLEVITDNGWAYISTLSEGTGDAGNIEIDADSVLLSKGLGGSFTGITTQTNWIGEGKPGDLRLNTNSLEILGGAQVSNTIFNGSKDGGSVDVNADTIFISGLDAWGYSSGIFSSVEDYQEPFATGNGGRIRIVSNDLEVTNGGQISVFSNALGDSGNIEIQTGSLKITDNASISAKSTSTGNAGNIHIEATDTFLMDNSSVTTEAVQADGGNIKVSTEHMVHLNDSMITASVGGGPDTVGGNISIDPEYVILNNSSIIANAFEGRGGNIDITAHVFLADPSSIVDASSALGIDGQVDIRAPVTEISGTLAPLRKDFRSALALLRKPCIARMQRGKYSSFVIGGRDGLPLEPGGLLPSPLF